MVEPEREATEEPERVALIDILQQVRFGLDAAQENLFQWFEEDEESIQKNYESAWSEVRPHIDMAMEEVHRIAFDKLEDEGLTGHQLALKYQGGTNLFLRFVRIPGAGSLKRFLKRVDVILESLNSVLPYGVLGPVIEIKKTVEDGLKE